MSDKKLLTPEEEQTLKNNATARRRVLMINPDEFASLFTQGLVWKKKTKIAEGIPADAKVLGTAFDLRLNAILMVVESEEYDEVKMTDIPPRQPISIIQGEPGATKKKATKRK